MVEYKISHGAKILFVGINPHPGSHRRGVPFSNNKMFWYLLNRAGLLRESEDDLKDDAALRRIYAEKFMPKYGLNFVNLVDRPTVVVTELRPGEERAGVRRARQIIRKHQPKVVCFIGKVTFNKFYGCRDCEFGWHTDIERSKVYLMHFPIRGLASIRVKELKEIEQMAKLGHVAGPTKANRPASVGQVV
ncbi:MAG TPA: mismatch-specific DNA-glycosylase [Verrucomicrobiota bacterium]|nr:mismatch-specific DNA-glycosylase [Verrucomicrobiota bacterium]HNT15812.1 mismatch-specific DNA-glycosylase [Verrucomicrobiota bacterium]